MTDIDALLRRYDAEPDARLTAAEAAHREWLLAQITSIPSAQGAPGARPRRAAVRRLARPRLVLGITAAAVAVVAVAAGLAASGQGTGQAGPLTRAELDGWTAKPEHPAASSPLARQAGTACAGGLSDSRVSGTSVDIVNVDQRGAVITVLAKNLRFGVLNWCLATSGGIVLSERISAPDAPLPTIGADQVNLVTAGTDGFGSAGAVSEAIGQAGADVTGVTLETSAGELVTATVQGGFWSLWFPPGDSRSGGLDLANVTVTWTTSDGARHSAPALGIMAAEIPVKNPAPSFSVPAGMPTPPTVTCCGTLTG
jgi:hypothetical protein